MSRSYDYSDMYAPRLVMAGVDGDSLSSFMGSAMLPFADIIGDVSSFSYESVSRGMDKLILQVRNPDLKYKDDPRFRANQKYAIRFGYPMWFSNLKKVIVVRAQPVYPLGMPMIELTAYDTGRALALGSSPRNWANRKSSDIAKLVAQQFGMEFDIEDSRNARLQNRHRIQPASVTPYEYLDQLADQLGWDFYVEDNTLHFHPMRMNGAPSRLFTYYTSSTSILKSFSPDVKAAKAPRIGRAGPGGRHPATPATGPATPRAAANTAMWGINAETREGTKIPGPVTTPSAESDTRVRQINMAGLQTKIDMAAVTAAAELVGCPDVMARNLIEIQGVDQEYAGIWRVKTADHRIDPSGGYTTSLKLTRMGLNSSDNHRRHRNSPATTNQNGGAAPTPPALQINSEDRNTTKILRVTGAPATR